MDRTRDETLDADHSRAFEGGRRPHYGHQRAGTNDDAIQQRNSQDPLDSCHSKTRDKAVSCIVHHEMAEDDLPVVGFTIGPVQEEWSTDYEWKGECVPSVVGTTSGFGQ